MNPDDMPSRKRPLHVTVMNPGSFTGVEGALKEIKTVPNLEQSPNLKGEETPEGTRRYLIETDKEMYIIEVPDNWKITFGALSPGANKGFGTGPSTLRLYETKDKQRACFPGVSSFRDLSIPITRLS